MMDPQPGNSHKRKAVYVANFYYGNHLLEFTDTHLFKQLRYRKRYTLPYYYIGTGHVVYKDNFYYNRAFTKNVIKYSLKDERMTAWTHLSEAVYKSESPFSWRGHSWVTMSVDYRGLWVIYPSIDPYDYHREERIKLHLLNPEDLSVITIIETSTLSNKVGHLFMMCGVLYATDPNTENKPGVIRYAIDTMTGRTNEVYIEYPNTFRHVVQLQYNMHERALFVWDNRHQMVYYLDMI